MARTTAEKLQFKPGMRVLLARADADRAALLGPLPEGTTTHTDAGDTPHDGALVFADDRAALDDLLATTLPGLTTARAVWIAYRKGNATDINRDSIRERAAEEAWTVNSAVSLSDAWSALRVGPSD